MMNVLEIIKQKIRETECFSFVEFMQLALYAPQGGYYSTHIRGFGSEGDFITAPELTSLFGATLAKQIAQVLTRLVSPCILELGAGSGRLCVDVLKQLECLRTVPTRYFILEVSARLREQQYQLVKEELPHWIDRVQWLQRWPEAPFEGVIIANEVLDAMPVHRFLKTEEGLHESYIRLGEDNALEEYFLPSTNHRLLTHLAPLLSNETLPYLSEANLWIDGWMKECYACLSKGAVFLFDYGFPQHEYYHPDRRVGTLMCHYQHHSHTNPLINVGEQDITAHVDFSHVANAAHQAGFHVSGYTHQAAFLLACGILDLLENIEHTFEASLVFKTKAAVKQLLQSSEMGEIVKVIALTKDFDQPLEGFQFFDKRASL